jgi:O-antigen ligase
MIKNKAHKLSAFETMFCSGIIFILTISIIRGIPYIDRIPVSPDDELNLTRYLLSYLVKPFTFFLPLILIVKFIRDETGLTKVLYGLFCSLFSLSVYILVTYIFFVQDKTNFEVIRLELGTFLNLHGNEIADFYIISLPVLAAFLFHKKNAFLISTLLLSIMAIAILYSRTAYFTIVLSLIFLFAISGRKKYLPILIAALAILIYLLPGSVIFRALHGIADGSIDLNEMSSGRIEDIWLPLIYEYIHKPFELTVGDGFLSILHTDVFVTERILSVSHPHNMYLEIVLNAGLLGLFIYVILFAKTFRVFAAAKQSLSNNPLLRDIICGIIVSVAAYLLSGVTGRSLFPSVTNAYTQILIGVGFALKHLAEKDSV